MDLVLVDTRSGRRRSIALGADPIVLGSGIDCDVVIPAPEVAERACRASVSPDGGGGIVLESLDGAGFMLNDRKARNAILHPGDVVKLGPFQLVAAGSSAPRAPAPPPGPPKPTAEQLAAKAARDAQFTTRRQVRQHSELSRIAPIAALLLFGGAGFVLWKRGVFASGDETLGGTPTGQKSTETAASPEGGAPVDGAPSDDPTDILGPSGTSPEGEAADASAARKSSTKDITDALANVRRLLDLGEFARCRYLLWQLAPASAEDRARVETRRQEVDAAGNKAGEDHLKFVDDLVKRGKIAAALGQCEEEAIERFKGLEAWYKLLEKADEIEVVLDEHVGDERLRPRAKRKHARPMPADLATRPPPAVEEQKVEPELVARPFADLPGGKPRPPTPEPAPEPPKPVEPVAATPEEIAARAVVNEALRELAAAKLTAFDSAAKKVTEAAHAAQKAAAAPLLARCEELATALDAAPERAAIDELRKRVEALAQARTAALAFLFDEKRYGMPEPGTPAEAARAETEKAQKEAEKLVDQVRDLWGSEQGSAPAPQVALSDDFTKLVQQARLLDGLLAEIGANLPDRGELRATRLIPLWAPKLSVRNYALNVEERRRIDADRETKTRNQQVKDIKDTDHLELLALTNAYREMLGRPQLASDRKLYDEAHEYADLLAKQVKNAKESDPQPEPTPHVSGKRPSAGANYLREKTSPRQALQAWCKVPAAHRNLLELDHHAMAAANVGTFWAQLFGLTVPSESPAGK